MQIQITKTVTRWGYRCERCGYEWFPRITTDEPLVCPGCNSPYWNTPRKRGRYIAKAEERARQMGQAVAPGSPSDVETATVPAAGDHDEASGAVSRVRKVSPRTHERHMPSVQEGDEGI